MNFQLKPVRLWVQPGKCFRAKVRVLSILQEILCTSHSGLCSGTASILPDSDPRISDIHPAKTQVLNFKVLWWLKDNPWAGLHLTFWLWNLEGCSYNIKTTFNLSVQVVTWALNSTNLCVKQQESFSWFSSESGGFERGQSSDSSLGLSFFCRSMEQSAPRPLPGYLLQTRQ